MTTPLKSAANIMAQALINQGLGSDMEHLEEWPTATNYLPDAPDEIIVVYSTSGLIGTKGQKEGKRWLSHGFQVLIRGVEREEVESKGLGIERWLDEGIKRLEVSLEGNSFMIHSCKLTSELTFIGLEETGRRRNLFSLNGRVTITAIS